jgi:RNA polymerase sigma-70 factor (ECF subfamily)
LTEAKPELESIEGNSVTTLSDNLLLERISQGDTATFESVFHQHYDRVYGLLFRLVGNRVEAEDLTQEVFLKLYNHAYRKRLFGRGREHNIGAWLYRVATNTGYNAIRGRQRRWQRNTALVPDPQGGYATEKEVEQREMETAVRRALSQLQPRQVQLLLMRQMDFSYADCAAAVGVAPGSVGTLLGRAAKAFREAYEAEREGKIED